MIKLLDQSEFLQVLHKKVSSSSKGVLLYLPGGKFPTLVDSRLWSWIFSVRKQRELDVYLTDERIDTRQSNFVAYNLALGTAYANKLWEEKPLPSLSLGQLQRDDLLKIAVLGVGSDGHLAGILAHSEESGGLFWTELVARYETGLQGSDFPVRETLTFRGLEQVDTIMLFVTGYKPSVIAQLIDPAKPTAAEVAAKPVLFLKTLDTEVVVFVA